ncbi:MAG: 5-bromo-4-chloroindolyl phosphate hydrolysis family protein [Desulfovibrio sp.]|nr:5-bromo-4-chloroindolyl phosphate hydrolysis family protein [Desulfovibrio sp.]
MTTLSDTMASGFARMTAALGQIGRRLLVHMAALAMAALVSAAATGILPESANTTLAAYIGLICLFPRGNPRDASWFLPTLLGIVQAIVLVVFGIPWPLVILWGGLQTWVQRLLSCRGSFGWEWAVAPMLAVSLCLILQDFLDWGIGLWPLLSFPFIVAAGAVGIGIYRRVQAGAIHDRMLEETLQRLHKTLSWRALPEEAQQQGELLLAQANAYKAIPRTDAGAYALVERVDSVSREMEDLSQEWRVLNGNAGHALARTVLRSSRWKEAHTPKTDALLKTVRECNVALLEALDRHKAHDRAKGTSDRTDAGRMAEYEDSARKLLLKTTGLPVELKRHVEGIATSALGIVEGMRQDPADMPGGHKFLGRYLPATHRVVDEYVRLAAENSGQEDVTAALARSGEILERMAVAFADERTSMLQNDAINYTAELNALDTMLKMRGK